MALGLAQFMTMARVLSTASKHPTCQVGCLLVSPDARLLVSGYNGFPAGYPETPEMWHTPSREGHICRGTFVRHAEENAVANARCDLRGWTAYITHHPCLRCAGTLIHVGIAQVYWSLPIKAKHHPELAQLALTQAGVPFAVA